MTKTRVLLAFGRHGNIGRGKAPMVGNVRFFQNSACDFVEKNPHKKIVVIHEEGPGLGGVSSANISRLTDVWTALQAFKGFKRERENLIADIEPKRAYMESVMNAALQDQIKGRCGAESISDPFGMVDFAREIHEDMTVLVEPQTGEAYYLGVLYGILEKALSIRRYENGSEWSAKDVDIMVDLLKVFAELSVHRDRNVVGQIETIADMQPDALFIVPRGYGHRHMAENIDGSRFDVAVQKEEGVYLGFSDDVLSMSYSGDLEEPELRRHAMLNLDYEKEMEKLWGSFLQKVKKILTTQEEFDPWFDIEKGITSALNDISKRAREFALGNEKK
ncbi:hypothetical protein KKE92_03055 [Candidatus Micrarchaeota archaeon]|nr:hypothetical protein [Candidatus Micrarchaeota archaeon]MBU1681700.1 hypothetical protein [Candidatus Micrarchaeota archaeon]